MLGPVWPTAGGLVRQAVSAAAGGVTLPMLPVRGSVILAASVSNAVKLTTMVPSGGGCVWACIGRAFGPVSGAQIDVGLFLGIVDDTPSTSVSVSVSGGSAVTMAVELPSMPRILTHPSIRGNLAGSGTLALPSGIRDRPGGIVVYIYGAQGTVSAVPSGIPILLDRTNTVRGILGLRARVGAEAHSFAFAANNQQAAIAAVIRPT